MIFLVGYESPWLAKQLLDSGMRPAPERFRGGAHHGTNPGPDGSYVFPEEVAGHVVCANADAIARTDPAYLERVVVVFQDWRRGGALREWLGELALAIEDASLRGHPLWLFDADDRDAVRGLAGWLDRPLSDPPTRALTEPSRTPSASDVKTLDAFVDALRQRAPLPPELLDALAAVHESLQ